MALVVFFLLFQRTQYYRHLQCAGYLRMSIKYQAPSLLSLYTGAGGLDLGLEAAGFNPKLCIEVDADSRATILLNRPGWRLSDPGDIHAMSPAEILRQANLKPRQ